MARGITENDVFAACDALLLAGERPTIERVRQKIGRGSPNTVSPMLDAWFKGLGRRLQDPGAFSPPPDIPGPVLQAAQHFWEVAQASARADLEERVVESLRPMQDEVDRALHAEAVAMAERDAEAGRARDARQELADVGRRLDVERVAHGATTALADASRSHTTALQARLEDAEALLRDTEERARREILVAQERATGAERRAALEIENERAARGRAEKRADGLEKRLDALQTTSATQLEELVSTRTSRDHECREVQRLQQANDLASRQRETMEAALVEAKLAIGRAESEAKTTQATMNQLLPLIGELKPKKSSAKERAHAKGT